MGKDKNRESLSGSDLNKTSYNLKLLFLLKIYSIVLLAIIISFKFKGGIYLCLQKWMLV